MGMRKSYERPQLPSHFNNIVQLSFMTILECATAPKRGTPEDLATPHAEKQKASGAYRTGLRPTASGNDGYCPGSEIRFMERRCETYVLSVFQHRDGLVASPAGSDQAEDGQTPTEQGNERQSNSEETDESDKWAFEDKSLTGHPAQNACKLPFEIERLLNTETMGADALYALSDVFRFSAASHNQVLNLVAEETVDSIAAEASGLALLLADRERLLLPKAAEGTQPRADTDRMARLLLCDFQAVQRRAEDISKPCDHAIQSLINDATARQSAAALETVQRIERLTALAAVFLPLTLAASLLGMNEGTQLDMESNRGHAAWRGMLLWAEMKDDVCLGKGLLGSPRSLDVLGACADDSGCIFSIVNILYCI
ncbi:hypothetical protein S40293_11253 [Stachybotrys chartarum IBT 40293]|nr:hypothetical protein S40293_11253 [Stachybotrys chartarum IBT 40293]